MSFGEKFVSCNIYGGLGNQLFQIATTLALAWKRNLKPVFLDRPWTRLGETLEYNKTILRHLTWLSGSDFNKISFETFDQPSFGFCEFPLFTESILINGYFQSWRFFEDVKDRIREEIIYLSEEDKALIEKSWSQIHKTEIIIAVHVRRGDTIPNSWYHTLIPNSYYEKAMNHLKEVYKDENISFCIFSDDLEWCKKEPLFSNCTFFSSGTAYIDLIGMSRCSALIIGNSTFSWWAAYLSGSEHVVYPDKWFGPGNSHLDISGLHPDKWRKIEY